MAMIVLLLTALTVVERLFVGMRLWGWGLGRGLGRRRHVVVCGLGRIGSTVACDAASRGLRVVALRRVRATSASAAAGTTAWSF